MLYIFSRFIMWFFSEDASLIFLQVCLLRQHRLPAEQVAKMLMGKMLAATPVDTGTEQGSAQLPGVALSLPGNCTLLILSSFAPLRLSCQLCPSHPGWKSNPCFPPFSLHLLLTHVVLTWSPASRLIGRQPRLCWWSPWFCEEVLSDGFSALKLHLLPWSFFFVPHPSPKMGGYASRNKCCH